MFDFLNRCLTHKAVSPDHASYLRRLRLYRLGVILVQWLLLLSFLVLWEAAADLRIIDAFITSQPSKIWDNLLAMTVGGTLFLHLGTTLGETMVGFFLGTFLGVAVAIALWWSDFLSRVLDPYLIILNATPRIALGPIFIIWLGNGSTAIVVMALAISLITTILMVYNGFRQVDGNQIKLLRSFGASRSQILTKVVLPASIPTMIAAAKVNVGLTLVGVIMGEFLVSQAGLGYLIIYGGQVFNLSLVMTSVVILALVAAALNQGVNGVESWYRRQRGH